MSQITIATFDAEGRKTAEIAAASDAPLRIGVRDTMIESGSAIIPIVSAFAGLDVAAPKRAPTTERGKDWVDVADAAPSEAPAAPKRKSRKRARR